MTLEYVDSWDTIFHQHHMETQVAHACDLNFQTKYGASSVSDLSVSTLVTARDVRHFFRRL